MLQIGYYVEQNVTEIKEKGKNAIIPLQLIQVCIRSPINFNHMSN